MAQCGGEGNIAGTLAAADEVGAAQPYARHLAGRPDSCDVRRRPARPRRASRGAGFTGARAWLEEAPAVFGTLGEGAEFLGVVVLRHHLERLPEALRAPFARAVAERRARPDGRVEIDYVRLNLAARRPA